MYLLTELVRLLEQRGYIFPSDPQAVTESLRPIQDSNEAKLHRRAIIIDRTHELHDRLNRHNRHKQLILWAATIFWFTLGWGSTYTLMQQSNLNFFLILTGALGINTMMLLFWLFTLFTHRNTKLPLVSWFELKNQDNIAQALFQLYAQTATLPHTRWQAGIITHRLALSALIGIFGAALLLLTVRQYSFNWESTLLTDHTFITIVHLLAWLPEKMGFAVPDVAAILVGRNAQDTVNAAAWGSLLLGSIVCYGLLPRFIAWTYCLWRTHRSTPSLDLNLPYYQNIIQQWQRRITDSADDYHADVAPQIPPVQLNHQGAHWAVLLDTPHHDENWFYHQLGQDWINHGILASREDVTNLINDLTHNPVQLLIGVRGNQVPDRGTVRTLQRLAQSATNGLIIQLLLPENTTQTISGSHQETLMQWRQVLHEHQYTWLEPPIPPTQHHPF
ncbi:MAG: DUF2868 domain-containing protein [Alysiella sp.]|uniref:DUF2868 domain-containing protein n=1 Tax=Alysiella sp. TaxID=1872483 RepID=UPI0026DC8C1B|nr:DUF2868 domain-containing protein [Alysiella sp.]MDO4433079.1 DUF2868 domain-containing protein [Alysiella sp.]